MRELTLREKNLSVIVVIVCGFGMWWYTARMFHRRIEGMESEILGLNERIRQTNGSLAQLRSAGAAGSTSATPTISNSRVSLALLKDLTLPMESEAVRVVTVNRGENGAYTMTVEGQFGEMMRFLSYLERQDSRFSVGGIQFGRISENGVRRIRASFQIAAKG